MDVTDKKDILSLNLFICWQFKLFIYIQVELQIRALFLLLSHFLPACLLYRLLLFTVIFTEASPKDKEQDGCFTQQYHRGTSQLPFLRWQRGQKNKQHGLLI